MQKESNLDFGQVSKEEENPKPESVEENGEPDIIPIDFSKRKNNPDVKKEPLPDDYESILSMESFRREEGNQEKVTPEEWNRAVKRAKEIRSYLYGRKGTINNTIFHDSSANFAKEFSDRYLIEVVLAYDEFKWNKNVAYYRALANEMIMRYKNEMITRSKNKEKPKK